MYAKVFRQMYDGSLATVGPWEAMVTFQQFLILADRYGDVDMTPEVIARTSTIPLEIILKGIDALTKPDEKSRTPSEDGRRITLIDPHRDWGWTVVNYEKYAAMRSAEERREYKRRWMEHKRKLTNVDSVDVVDLSSSSSSSSSSIVLTDSSPEATTGPKVQPVPYEAIGDSYNEICVSLPRQKSLNPARRRAIKARWAEDPKRQNLGWWKEYFAFIQNQCPFLTGGNDRNWVADFDFVIKGNRMTSIREGKYSHGTR